MTKPSISPPAIILVRPREEGNVGAVARAMANMGLEQLILVEPAPTLGGVARGFGVGGWHILDSCQRFSSLAEASAPFRRLVGTSSARSRPLRQTQVITPRQLPTLLAGTPQGTPVALVFGPEDSGLTQGELQSCEPVVTIPCAPEHPTLNLAQSVLILAYELYLAQGQATDEATMDSGLHTTACAGPSSTTGDLFADSEPPATTRELEALFERTEAVLLHVGLDQEQRRTVYLREMRRFARRGAATSREVRLILRLANRTLSALKSRDKNSPSRDGRKGGENDRVRSAEPHPPSRRRLDE